MSQFAGMGGAPASGGFRRGTTTKSGSYRDAAGQETNAPPRMPGYQGGDLSQPPMEWNQGSWATQAAPAGYEWDPVKGGYSRTPTAQGQAVNQYNTAANPALAGLLSSIGGGGGSLSGMMGGGSSGGGGSMSGGGSSMGSNAYGTSGVSGGGYVPTLQMPDQSASSAASFAAAKDRVGKTSRASLDALRGELGASGMLGGGAEGQLTRDVIQSGAGELGQVSRDQAVKEADLAGDFAKTSYAGGITQRGQDVSAAEAQARLAQEARLSDANLAFQKQSAAANQQMQMLQLALSGLKGGSSASGLVY